MNDDEDNDCDSIISTINDTDEDDAVFESDSTEINRIHYVKDDDEDVCEEIEMSDGSFVYKPIIDESEKPKLGNEYPTVEACVDMYSKYAEKSGFTIRKWSQEKLKSGTVSRKYLVCNKEGLPSGVYKDTMSEESRENEKRTGSVIRSGCEARVKFKINATRTAYVLYEFEEAHNHHFVPKVYRNLTKKRKKMSQTQQVFLQQMCNTNIGATRAHQLYVNTHGGYESVTATETEFRNHQRELNSHIGESDAQMLIDKMESKVKFLNNFSFEYITDEDQLQSLFWADEMAKINYKEFGDTISFDATFRTNKYNMVFVPFTGIDNHRKCVTFGAGMLCNETTKSYKWLLRCFLKAFKNQPRLVVTDQDPAMRKAIAAVFTESTHRLCIWHITNKLPLKICKTVLDNGHFRRRLHHLVWSMYIEPEEFEMKWNSMIEEFNLQENKWLSDMYDIRTRWIPAYFRDVELCGLMRTTSRSESENSFFSNFTSGGSTLLRFMMCFEAAMEKQRYRQEILDDATIQKKVRYKTQLPIERYAQTKYTKAMFLLIQEEVCSGVYDCHQISENVQDGIQTLIIKETRQMKQRKSRKKYDFGESIDQSNKNKTRNLQFKVSINPEDGRMICSCMNFARFGFLCRHIFCVLKGNRVDVIPDEYVLRRWTRDILPPHIRRNKQITGNEGESFMESSHIVYSAMDFCLNILAKDKIKLSEFVESVKRLKSAVEEGNPGGKQMTRKEMFDQVLGVKKQSGKPKVKNPEKCSTKGNVSEDKRMKSELEKLRDLMKRSRRNCAGCKKKKRHDIRTCPLVKDPTDIQTDSDTTQASSGDED